MTAKKENKDLIWAYLIHLGMNMWWDRQVPERDRGYEIPSTELLCEDAAWEKITGKMAKAGMNMLVIDLGEGIKYESHPEIGIKKSWSVKKLKKELERLRGMGIEPIPKLNFSATHDTWLGPYSRCLSTDTYYRVCTDIINEVIDIFDKPRFFHLGMDEETAVHQRYHRYVVIRQFDLWWHDLHFYLDTVGKKGVTPWVWSDYLWHHPDEYFLKMPKNVIQSNWYYDKKFSQKINYVNAFLYLERHGYLQIPAGSNHLIPENFENLVRYCRKNIAPRRLMGFFQTVWKPTTEQFMPKHLEAIELVAGEIEKYKKPAKQEN